MAQQTNHHPTRIIHAWSGPRSLSTALLYSFSQRPDCQTFDEPLYANYLRTFATLHRPYRQQLLDSEPRSSNEVISSMIEAASSNSSKSKLVFAKHIIKQYTDDIDFELLTTPGTRHIFLIRNPLDMIMSWNQKNHVHNESQDIYGTTVMELVALFTKLKTKTGITPIVIDVDELVKDPEGILSKVCLNLGIPFYHEQLSWPEGPKPDIDGLWASFWYDSVHKTTGFQVQNTKVYQEPIQSFTSDNYLVYRDSFPFYEMLRNYAIGIDPFSRGQTHCPGRSTTIHNQVGEGKGVVIDHGRSIDSSSLSDSRNAQTLIWVGDRLVPREYAKVSVFDSTVQGGDAVWEGLRIYNKRVFKLEEHLHRLLDSAKALAFENVPDINYIRQAIFTTLRVNGMFHDCHIRLTLSRGTKMTSSMNPQFNIFGCVLLVVPEWKPVGNKATYNNETGITLITSYNRRNTPSCLDSKIHHCNLLNNILPKIQANLCGAADALMLDVDGFVSETNATNIFLVKNGRISTPSPDSCLPGITRQTIINFIANNTIPDLGPVIERRISLVEFHTADEVFTTGTMGELTPVAEIDGRRIGDGSWPITRLIQEQFRILTDSEGVPIPGL